VANWRWDLELVSCSLQMDLIISWLPFEVASGQFDWPLAIALQPRRVRSAQTSREKGDNFVSPQVEVKRRAREGAQFGLFVGGQKIPVNFCSKRKGAPQKLRCDRKAPRSSKHTLEPMVSATRRAWRPEMGKVA